MQLNLPRLLCDFHLNLQSEEEHLRQDSYGHLSVEKKRREILQKQSNDKSFVFLNNFSK